MAIGLQFTGYKQGDRARLLEDIDPYTFTINSLGFNKGIELVIDKEEGGKQARDIDIEQVERWVRTGKGDFPIRIDEEGLDDLFKFGYEHALMGATGQEILKLVNGWGFRSSEDPRRVEVIQGWGAGKRDRWLEEGFFTQYLEIIGHVPPGNGVQFVYTYTIPHDSITWLL